MKIHLKDADGKQLCKQHAVVVYLDTPQNRKLAGEALCLNCLSAATSIEVRKLQKKRQNIY